MAAIERKDTAIQHWQSTREQTNRGIVELIGDD
jgi:hypothetical protein